MRNLLSVFIDGLTYAGNLQHSLINYGLIALTLLPFFAPDKGQSSPVARRWLSCLLVAVVVQALLWFLADAVGVSIIWCMMAGYTLLVYLTAGSSVDPRQHRLLVVALISALLGIAYYAWTFPLITTVAHGMAVALGIGLFFLFRWLRANH